MTSDKLDLMENLALGKMLASSAAVLIWISNGKKECVYFNQAWLSFRGRTLAEEYGFGWADGVHPEDYARCIKIYNEAFDARKPFCMDYRLQRHDNVFRWIRDEGVPYYDPQEGFVGYLGSCFDVTEMIESRKAILQSEQRFQLLVNSIDEVFWMSTLGVTECIYVSPAFEKIWGMNVATLYQSPIAFVDVIHPDDRETYLAIIDAYHMQGKAYECNYRICPKHSDIRWINERGYPVKNEETETVYMAGVCTDITKQRDLEDRILINETGKLAQVGGLQLNIGSQEMSWTAETYRIYEVGSSIEVCIEDVFRNIESTHLEDSRYQFLSALRNRTKIAMEYPLLLKGKKKWISLKGEIVERENGQYYLYGAVQDITIQKSSEQKLRESETNMEYLAYHDPLTKLPNRLFFYARLKTGIARAKRNNALLAVLLIDLDRFKVINDTLGHGVGDLYLKEVSERLAASIRASDTATRLGGDEFALIVEDVKSFEDIATLARKMLKRIALPVTIQKQELYSTASIGLSVYPNDGDSAEVLLKAADIAMYRAKGLGKNTFCFFNKISDGVAFERLTLEADLLKAIEAQQFYLEYQPQFDLLSGKVTGVEALARWNHPKKGRILPDVFIPIAEEAGCILTFGEWVLTESVRQLKRWLDKGMQLDRIAVNLSALQFRHMDLVSGIGNVLEQYQLDPKCLEVEITESLLMRDLDTTIDILQALKNMGLSLSIDDFGTGYSSLSYLKRFAIDKLKIDKSFVSDLENDPNDAAISASIIALAHKMNLKVIAEGVENEQQVEFLKLQNCDEVQGYYYGEPMSVDHIEVYMNDHA